MRDDLGILENTRNIDFGFIDYINFNFKYEYDIGEIPKEIIYDK
jgi:hypothetical protein